MNSEIGGDPFQGHIWFAIAGDADDVVAELSRERLRGRPAGQGSSDVTYLCSRPVRMYRGVACDVLASSQICCTGEGCVIDAYGELQELGHFGRRGLELLHGLVRQEARKYPGLIESSSGYHDLVDESTQEFFATQGAKVTAGLLAQTNDLESMSRYLRKCV